MVLAAQTIRTHPTNPSIAGAIASGQFTATGVVAVLLGGLAAQNTQATNFTNPSTAGAVAIGQYTKAGVVVVLFSVFGVGCPNSPNTHD